MSGHDFDSEITACFEYARDKTVIDNRGNTIGNPGHNPLPPSPLPELPAGQDVLSNLALGAGLSTPVVLLAAGILLVLVLRR